MRRLLLIVLLSLPVQKGAGQGYLCAIGGGDESSGTWARAPYSWIVQRADSQDVVVLSASAETAWIPDFFLSLGARSAFNLTVPSRAAANDSAAYRAIRSSRAVFIKGGDQWAYVSFWKGTLVAAAIRDVFTAGGVVAGTSAGAMVLGEAVSDARNGTEVSRNALRNPRSAKLTLTWDFLRLLPSVLIDTHFHERGRLGRLLAMTAAASADSGRPILGIGIEDMTALCVDPSGRGEVMGSGSVTFFHPLPSSRIVAAPGAPLIFTQGGFDALVAGFVYDIPQRRVVTVPPFAVVPGPGADDGGTGAAYFWGDRFPSPAAVSAFLLEPGVRDADVQVIAPTGNAAGLRLLDTLRARGCAGSVLVGMDSASANDSSTAATLSRAGAFVFIGNTTGGAVPWVDGATRAGSAVRSTLGAGVPSAFAGPDASLAGRSMVLGTEIEEYAAYRGKMSTGTGLSAAPRTTVMPLIFESDVYDENRCTGLPWGMARTDTKVGLYLDEGGYAAMDRAGTFSASGPTPLIILDARAVTHAGFSAYRAPGSAGFRQEAALIGGMVHVISGDVRWASRVPSGVNGAEGKRGVIPGERLLLENYPNPFNPSTIIPYRLLVNAHVSLRVYDLLGREVAVLVDERKAPGNYAVRFDGSALSSGMYFCRIETSGRVETRAMILLR
jgi:cyanophycinase